MVTIYTENGLVTEPITEKPPFNFGRLAAVTLATAILLSAVAIYNLNRDVKDVTNDKMAYVQQRVAAIQATQYPGSM